MARRDSAGEAGSRVARTQGEEHVDWQIVPTEAVDSVVVVREVHVVLAPPNLSRRDVYERLRAAGLG